MQFLLSFYSQSNWSSNEINLLKEGLNKISERDENLRKLVKLPPINSDIRKLGVGGPSTDDKFNEIKGIRNGKFNWIKIVRTKELNI